MTLIGEISALQEWKSDGLATGQLSIWTLAEKAKWILEALERAIDRLTGILDLRMATGLNRFPGPGKHLEIYTVTNIFACAAVVYLHSGKALQLVIAN